MHPSTGRSAGEKRNTLSDAECRTFFFSHRTILDIINIIKLAQNPMDTEAFLQIYYKIGTYLRKQDAIRIARISEEKESRSWMWLQRILI